MKYIDGDLVALAKDGRFDVIAHGCNCFCTMNSGIAPQIRRAFPGVYEVDCATVRGDETKMGTYSKFDTGSLVVLNCYTQYTYGTEKRQVDYDALQSVFRWIKFEFGGKQLRFGFPRIGAGLAGGDWNIISEIIEREMADEDVVIVNYVKG